MKFRVIRLNPSSLTVTLESTQPVKNEYLEYLLGRGVGGARLERTVETLLFSRAECVEILEP